MTGVTGFLLMSGVGDLSADEFRLHSDRPYDWSEIVALQTSNFPIGFALGHPPRYDIPIAP